LPASRPAAWAFGRNLSRVAIGIGMIPAARWAIFAASVSRSWSTASDFGRSRFFGYTRHGDGDDFGGTSAPSVEFLASLKALSEIDAAIIGGRAEKRDCGTNSKEGRTWNTILPFDRI
jgi:hypothetical protein